MSFIHWRIELVLSSWSICNLKTVEHEIMVTHERNKESMHHKYLTNNFASLKKLFNCFKWLHDCALTFELFRVLTLWRIKLFSSSCIFLILAASIHDPENPSVLIEGVLFRAQYLGSTQLISEGQPSKAMRMMQAQEAVGRIKVRRLLMK